MPYPRGAGHPDYSATGTTKFIPEVWSGKMQVKFYDATVLSVITNNDYEGEIRNHGDKVHIRTIPTLTINNYVKGQTLTYEKPEQAAIDLDIDQGFYWAFVVDQVDRVQSDIALIDTFSSDASEQLKINVDQNVFQYMDDNVGSNNSGATAGRISANINLGATEKIVDCGTVLDEENIPEDGRYMIIPAWMAGLIKKSDLKDASLTGDSTSVMRNGRLGMIDRFTLYSSNLLPTVSDGGNTVTNILFGHRLATTFASQITETESMRAESTFGDLVRGLLVFGREVVKGEGLGLLYARKG
jgi:hypothetical protein